MFEPVDTAFAAAVLERDLAARRAGRVGSLVSNTPSGPSALGRAAVVAVLAAILSFSLAGGTAADSADPAGRDAAHFLGDGAGRIDRAAEVARAGINPHLEMVMLAWTGSLATGDAARSAAEEEAGFDPATETCRTAG